MSTTAVINIGANVDDLVAQVKRGEEAMMKLGESMQKTLDGPRAKLADFAGVAMGVQIAIQGITAAWEKFGALLKSGDDVERVATRLRAFTGGAFTAAEAAKQVVKFADTPPFGLEETQRAAQLLLGCGVRASELKDTPEALGNVAAGGGASLETIGVRLSKAYQTGKVTMEVMEPLMMSGINVMSVMTDRLRSALSHACTPALLVKSPSMYSFLFAESILPWCPFCVLYSFLYSSTTYTNGRYCLQEMKNPL